MLNSQDPKKQFNISRKVFTDFLMVNGYLGEMGMFQDIIKLTKGDLCVKIPNVETLTEKQVIVSLETTELTFSDFEKYLEYLKIIDDCVGTPKPKKK